MSIHRVIGAANEPPSLARVWVVLIRTLVLDMTPGGLMCVCVDRFSLITGKPSDSEGDDDDDVEFSSAKVSRIWSEILEIVSRRSLKLY